MKNLIILYIAVIISFFWGEASAGQAIASKELALVMVDIQFEGSSEKVYLAFEEYRYR